MATVSVGRPLGQCRCCLNFGHHKDIMEPFYREGVEEVYLDAILHCFNLRLSSDAKLPKMICKSCIHRLNYAAEFKAMVIESEQELLKVLNGNIEFVNVAECNNRGVEDENPGYNTRIFKKGDESIKEEIEEEEILEINNIADEEVETNNADESVDKEVCVKEEDILEKNNIADEEVETNNADGSVDGDSITDEEDESNNVANDEISKVRKYKRKTQQASWDVTTMKRAMKEARKTSVRNAAIKYGISYSTLRRHIQKGSAEKKLGRFRNVFTKEQETELFQYLIHMNNLFYGLSKKEFCFLVFQYAEANNIRHPFKNNTAGDDWYKSFKARYPELSLRQSAPTSVAGAQEFNRRQVERFFDLLENQIDKHQVDATRIYNVDETCIHSTNNKPPTLLTKSEKKRSGVKSSVNTCELMTVVCCCNAAGAFIPPFLIFKQKHKNQRILDGAPPGSVFTLTEEGWISGQTFLEWLRHFVAVTRPTQDKKVILIMDDHASHKYLPALEYALQNNVIFISLAPYTSQRNQPLDRCIYGPLKSYFEQSVSVFQERHVGQIVSQYEIVNLFGKAYLKAATPKNVIKGFQSTGIWPTNRYIFSDGDDVPATINGMTEPFNESNIPLVEPTVTEVFQNLQPLPRNNLSSNPTVT